MTGPTHVVDFHPDLHAEYDDKDQEQGRNFAMKFAAEAEKLAEELKRMPDDNWRPTESAPPGSVAEMLQPWMAQQERAFHKRAALRDTLHDTTRRTILATSSEHLSHLSAEAHATLSVSDLDLLLQNSTWRRTRLTTGERGLIREGIRVLKIMSKPDAPSDHTDLRVQLHSALAAYAPRPASAWANFEEEDEDVTVLEPNINARLNAEMVPVSNERANRLEHALNCIPPDVHGVQLMESIIFSWSDVPEPFQNGRMPSINDISEYIKKPVLDILNKIENAMNQITTNLIEPIDAIYLMADATTPAQLAAAEAQCRKMVQAPERNINAFLLKAKVELKPEIKCEAKEGRPGFELNTEGYSTLFDGGGSQPVKLEQDTRIAARAWLKSFSFDCDYVRNSAKEFMCDASKAMIGTLIKIAHSFLKPIFANIAGGAAYLKRVLDGGLFGMQQLKSAELLGINESAHHPTRATESATSQHETMMKINIRGQLGSIARAGWLEYASEDSAAHLAAPPPVVSLEKLKSSAQRIQDMYVKLDPVGHMTAHVTNGLREHIQESRLIQPELTTDDDNWRRTANTKCGQGTSGQGPVKSLQLHLEIEASTKLRFEGASPLVLSEDPLEKLNEIFSKWPPIRIPIFPPFVAFEFKFLPAVTMPYDLSLDATGKGELYLHMMGPVHTINIIGDLATFGSGPDFSKSTVEMTGSVSAGVSLGLNLKAELFLSFVFLSFFQVGVGASVEIEFAAGADLGLSTANSACDGDEWGMNTINTHYVEYSAQDTALYDSMITDARTKQDGMVLGIGAWYYVTFPAFKLFFFAGFPQTPGDCSMFFGHVIADSMAEGWFKSLAPVKGTDGVSGAYTDSLMKKQTQDEKDSDAKWMHPLVDFAMSPFLLRDTLTHAIKVPIPTSTQKAQMLAKSAAAKKGGEVAKMNIFQPTDRMAGRETYYNVLPGGTQFKNGDVRLVTSDAPNRGAILVYYNNKWGALSGNEQQPARSNPLH